MRTFIKYLLIIFVLVLLLAFLGWGQVQIGYDGWHKTENAWSDISFIFLIVKYVSVAILIKNWKTVCMWYGRYRGNENLGELLCKSWHLFLVPFIIIEFIGYFR